MCLVVWSDGKTALSEVAKGLVGELVSVKVVSLNLLPFAAAVTCRKTSKGAC